MNNYIKSLNFLFILTPLVWTELASSPALAKCFLTFGDAPQLKDEHGGLNAFPNYIAELDRAIRTEKAYAPLGKPENQLLRAMFERLLVQVGGRLLFTADRKFRPIEVSKGVLHFKPTRTSRQLTIVWSENASVREPTVAGPPSNIIITLPQNYVADAAFETFLDVALTAHDLDRYTTDIRIQDEKAKLGEPRLILKPGQRDALHHVAAIDNSTSPDQSIALSVQAPPGYGKTLIMIETIFMRIRRASIQAGGNGMRNIHFVVTDRPDIASQLGEKIGQHSQLGISDPVNFELVPWEKADGRALAAELQTLTQRATILAEQNKHLIVTVNWNFLNSEVAKILNFQSDLTSLRNRTNGMYIDESSHASGQADRDTIRHLLENNPATILFGMDAEFLDPIVRNQIFKGQLFDVYRNEIPASDSDPSTVIIDHIRIGSARGEITPLVDRETDRVIRWISPKQVLQDLRYRGEPVNNNVYFVNNRDARLRNMTFGALIPHLHSTFTEYSGFMRVNTVALAEQWATYLNQYFSANGINRRVEAYHAGTPNKEEILARWRNKDTRPDGIDWLISPRSLDEAVDAPHAAAGIFLTDSIEEETFMELGGRLARRYPDKPHALMVHVTNRPIFHSVLQAGLRRRQSDLETKSLAQATPAGNQPPPGQVQVPAPQVPPTTAQGNVVVTPAPPPTTTANPQTYETQVDLTHVANSPQWQNDRLVPVFPVSVTDLGDVDRKRVVAKESTKKLFADLHSYFSGQKSEQEVVDRLITVKKELAGIFGDVDVLTFMAVNLSESGGADHYIRLLKRYKDGMAQSAWPLEACVTSILLEFSPAFAYLYALQAQLPTLDIEIAKMVENQTLEILLPISRAYRNKLQKSWPISEKEAMLRLQLTANIWPQINVNLDQPLATLPRVLGNLSALMVSLQATAEKAAAAMAAKTAPVSQIKPWVIDCLDGAETALKTASAIFKNDAVFPVLLNQLFYLRKQIIEQMEAGGAPPINDFIAYMNEIFFSVYPLQTTQVRISPIAQQIQNTPEALLRTQLQAIDTLETVIRNLKGQIRSGAASPSHISSELAFIDKFVNKLAFKAAFLHAKNDPLYLKELLEFLDHVKTIANWHLDFSGTSPTVENSMLTGAPSPSPESLINDTGDSREHRYEGSISGMKDWLILNLAGKMLYIRPADIMVDDASNLILFHKLDRYIFGNSEPDIVPSILPIFVPESVSADIEELKKMHAEHLTKLLSFSGSRLFQFRLVSQGVPLFILCLMDWYAQIAQDVYTLITLQKALPEHERLMPIEEYVAFFTAYLGKFSDIVDHFVGPNPVGGDILSMDLSMPNLPQAAIFSAYVKDFKVDELDIPQLAVLEKTLSDYRRALTDTESAIGRNNKAGIKIHLEECFRRMGLDKWITPPNVNRIDVDFFPDQRERVARLHRRVQTRLHRLDPRRYPSPR